MPHAADANTPAGRTTLAILLLLVLALFVQAALVRAWLAAGADVEYAHNLSRLFVLPALLAAVAVTLGNARASFAAWLPFNVVTGRLLLSALAVGTLLRVAAWAEVTARGAFGWIARASTQSVQEFDVTWSCPAPAALAVALLSWLVMVPLTEEVIHRGVVQGYLARFGPLAALIGSAAVFALLHAPGSRAWVFVTGVLLAVQFRSSGNLWLPLLTHASYDGLVVIDSLCLHLAWNPRADSLPDLGTGLVALAVLAASLFVAVRLSLPSRTTARTA